MRASYFGVAALGICVSLTGCYSNGGWHAPNWDTLAWWRTPRTEAPASPSMMAGPTVTRPSEAAMTAGERPIAAPSMSAAAPSYGGSQTSFNNNPYPNTGAPPVQQPYQGGAAARTADASAAYASGGRYDAPARDMTQRGQYDTTYPSAKIHSAQPASPANRDYGAPSENPYVAGERKTAATAPEAEADRYRSTDRYGSERSAPERDDAGSTGGRYGEAAPGPREDTGSLRYDARDRGLGKTGYEPGNTGYEPPAHKGVDRADYATGASTSAAGRDAQYQPGGTKRYSGSTATADRSSAPAADRGASRTERYEDAYGQPVSNDRGYDQRQPDGRYEDDYRSPRDSGAGRY